MSEVTIKILWLHDDLLDLYGDSGNLLLLERRIQGMGHTCVIEKKSIGDTLEFAGYDLVYLGPGKYKNLMAAAKHLVQYRDALKAYLEDGGRMLATGSAQVLFGKSFDGQECVGLFDYTAQETGEVDTHDFVAQMCWDSHALCYGFVNRTAKLSSEAARVPMFCLHETTLSQDFPENTEGRIQDGFYGTWMLGPVLVKNPALAKAFLKQILGENFVDYDDSLEEKALRFTLEEFLRKED